MLCMICDDQKGELETVQKIVEDYAGEHPDLFLSVRCFSSPFDMMDEMDRSGAPDIALLDICMPGVLGTEVAREIKRKSEDVTDIIFLTASSDFAVEAFALHVNDYLTKPYTGQRLKETLDRIIQKRRRRLYFPIQCGNEIHRIDLYAVTYSNLFCIYHFVAVLVVDMLFPSMSDIEMQYARNITRTLLYIPTVLAYLKFLVPAYERSRLERSGHGIPSPWFPRCS